MLACEQVLRSLIMANRRFSLFKPSANTEKNVPSKRASASQTQNFGEARCEWYQKARIKNIPVTGPMCKKAKRAREEHEASEITASNGWLDRFKKMFDIKSKVISCEAGGVREETVTSWHERFPDIFCGYSPENIFSMDETGQFFRTLPNRSLAEVSKKCAFFADAASGK